MAVDKEQKIKITVDANQAQRTLDQLSNSFKTVAVVTAGAGAALVGMAAAGAALGVELAQRGQAVEGLNTAFKNLYGSANALGSDGLAKLSAALGETVANVNILKEANEAALRGMDPKVFLKIAESADALGRTVGESTTEAFEGLSKALETGNKKMLAHYGITVDVTKSADGMSRAMAQLDANVKKAGDGGASAADSYDRFKSIISNTVDGIAKAINKNEDFAKAFDTLGDTIKEIDWQPLIDGLSSVISLISQVVGLIPDFQRGLAAISDSASSQRGGVFGAVKDFFGIGNANDTGDLATFDLSKAINAAKTGPEIEALRDKVYTLNLSFENQTKALNMVQDAHEKLLHTQDRAGDSSVKFKNHLNDATKGAEEAAKKVAKLGEDFEKLTRSTESDIKLSGLQRSFEEALKAGNTVGAQDLAAQYQTVIHDTIKAELIKTYTEAGYVLSEAQIEAIAGPRAEQAGQQMADSLRDSLQQAYEQSVDGWVSVFQNAITGVTFSWKDALTQLAVGFAAELANAVFGGLGASVGSLTDLGKEIGKAIFKETIAAAGSSISGGSGGGDSGGGQSLWDIASNALFGSNTTTSDNGGVTTDDSGKAIPAGGSSFGSFDPVSAAAAVAVQFIPVAIDYIGNKFFSGSSDPERLARRDLRGQLQQTGFGENLEFQSTRGTKSLFDSDYNLDMSGKFANQAAGLANPLAQIFTGGDDKLGSDLAGIFANASKDVGSFNEAIVNTQSIMEKLGINADQARDSVTELFLDGKISLGEFSSDLSNLNILASDNLTGKGSVSDALTIMANNFDNPRTQLKAMQFLFTEFAEIGVNSSHDIGSALVNQLGPEAQTAFDMLAQAGINSAEDLKNANADMIAFIFSNVIEPLRDEFTTAFDIVGDAANDAASQTQSSFEQIGNSAGKATEKVKQYGAALKSVAGGISTGNNSFDPNIPPGTHA